MPCRFTVSMVTDDTEHALSGWRRAFYRVHMAICPYCSEFAAQMTKTTAAVRETASTETATPLDPTLLAAFRAQASDEVANADGDGGEDA